jgi:hypothetical protein
MKRLEGLASPRAQARFLLCVGLFILPVGALVWLTKPGFMGPMFAHQPWDFSPLLGIVGIVIGEVLMYRIYHADPDDGERSWRYRDY